MQKNIKKDSTMQLQALILFTILITTFQSYAMDHVISSEMPDRSLISSGNTGQARSLTDLSKLVSQQPVRIAFPQKNSSFMLNYARFNDVTSKLFAIADASNTTMQFTYIDLIELMDNSFKAN